MRRQSAAATALWIFSERPGNRRIKARQVRRIQSGVALRFSPHSKTLARWPPSSEVPPGFGVRHPCGAFGALAEDMRAGKAFTDGRLRARPEANREGAGAPRSAARPKAMSPRENSGATGYRCAWVRIPALGSAGAALGNSRLDSRFGGWQGFAAIVWTLALEALGENRWRIMAELVGNMLVAQSGGPTAVINASVAGVIQEAGRHPDCIEEIYGGSNG